MDLTSHQITTVGNDPTRLISTNAWNNFLGDIEDQSSEAVFLADHGIVADGATVNSAATVNALITALGTRGKTFVFPRGLSLWDAEIQVKVPCTLVGYGSSSNSSVADGATVLRFPAGSNGLAFLANGSTGAQRSSVRDLTIYAASALATTATANYTAGSTTITITGGTNDYAANQCIRLEGAGPSYTMVGKTLATTNGSNVVTVTSAGGNPGVYVGQHITGAGIPAGTTVTAWNSTTITLSANCTATASGVAYTVKYPLVTRIASVSGSTITIAQTPTQTQNVTGGVLKHADAAIYADCTLDTDHVQAGSNFHIGLFLHGEGPNGQIADNGNFASSNFQGNWGGVVAWGFDAQVNNFFGCNIAGPEVSFLDISLIGNYLYGCHFAFNVGIAVPLASSYAVMFGCYFEGGTSYPGNNSLTYAYGCTGLRNGSGWLYYGGTDDLASGNAPNIRIAHSGSIQVGTALITKSFHSKSSDYLARFEHDLVARDSNAAPSGIGFEIARDGSRQYIRGWNATTNGFARLQVTGDEVELAPAHTVVATVDSAGVNLASGAVLKNNGTQVLTSRRTGWTADTGTDKRTANATYSGTAEAAYTQATIQALMDAVRDATQTIKALKADLTTHGIIGA